LKGRDPHLAGLDKTPSRELKGVIAKDLAAARWKEDLTYKDLLTFVSALWVATVTIRVQNSERKRWI
jgi:hypothetical protein